MFGKSPAFTDTSPYSAGASREWFLGFAPAMQRLDQRRHAERMVVKLSKHNRNAEEKVYCEERESKETVPSLPLDAVDVLCLLENLDIPSQYNSGYYCA